MASWNFSHGRSELIKLAFDFKLHDVKHFVVSFFLLLFKLLE